MKIRNVILAVSVIAYVCILMGCTNYDDGYFTIEENHEYGNGRELVFHNTNGSNEEAAEHTDVLLFHRYSGEMDTMRVDSYNAYVLGPIGYIQRVARLEKWLVLETKQPDMILDSTFVVNDSKTSGSLGDFSYEGQAKVFDSDLSQFWIVNKYTPDLYGPMNENEVKQQCRNLQIDLPITLEGRYDRYVETHKEIDGRMEERPKVFNWPNWNTREDKMLQ